MYIIIHICIIIMYMYLYDVSHIYLNDVQLFHNDDQYDHLNNFCSTVILLCRTI